MDLTHDTRSARLTDLASAAGDVLSAVTGDAAVTGVSYDSRRVRRGDLFVCVPGHLSDGHLYAREAVDRGAIAICAERPTGAGVPEVLVSNARVAMGRIAARFFGDPAADLTLVGVTGTNGKTTTVFLLDAIMRASGRTTGLMGTIETRYAGLVRPGVRTTPESVDFHEMLADMRSAGVDAVTLEVTSHALSLNRTEPARFAAAVFTNLSQDHLDFHASMEDYFNAKRSLFVPERAALGVINADDVYGRRLLAEAEIPAVSFGVSASADLRAEQIELRPAGSTFVAIGLGTEIKVSSPLVGSFNVSNCLAAAAASLQLGFSPEEIATGIESLPSVPGRFEPVDRGQPFGVIVDYAHTPDSLDNLLRAARGMVRERLICVFGCGGDRDRGKRPLMGSVAARAADVVIITSDNPRSEDPEAILGEILEGVVAVRASGADAVSVDRAAAIEKALGLASPGDVVVIAGKGHETGQEFADRKIPFDDRVVAAEVLGRLGWGEAGAMR